MAGECCTFSWRSRALGMPPEQMARHVGSVIARLGRERLMAPQPFCSVGCQEPPVATTGAAGAAGADATAGAEYVAGADA
jgi:hypothetical protein